MTVSLLVGTSQLAGHHLISLDTSHTGAELLVSTMRETNFCSHFPGVKTKTMIPARPGLGHVNC